MTNPPPRPAEPPRETVRARDLGVLFPGEPGPRNAITDVPGVEVGFVTLRADEPAVVRTGVTAILPRGRAGIGLPCAAGVAVLNGNGELTGRAWIDEAGQLSTPIALTNSHAVGAVHAGVTRWMARVAPEAAVQWLLPVVGETWDGYLNSINHPAVAPEHAERALDACRGGAVAEGNVGGGTGMTCYGFKGGTGTSSRVVRCGDRSWTVGVLAQANFGRRDELTVRGRPLGLSSAAPDPMATEPWLRVDRERAARGAGAAGAAADPAAAGAAAGARAAADQAGAGSVIVVVATDAPLLPKQCEAIARRVPLGLARTGTTGSHFSGDIFLAFSTAEAPGLASRLGGERIEVCTLAHLAWGSMNPFFAATVEAVEEAIVNALVAARTMRGRDGHLSVALPHAEVRAAFA